MPADWPNLIVLVYSMFIVAGSLAGGWLPSYVRLTHTRLQLMMSAVGGLMLGVGLFHLLPHASVELGPAAIDRVVMFSHSTLAAKPSYPGPGVWLRGAARALSRQVLRRQGDERLFHNDFSACDRYAGGPEAAARVRCPSHLILAREDQMTPTRAAGVNRE